MYSKESQQQWWASLPRPVVIAAAALITLRSGEWLMLKSTYRDGWQLPGGIVELGESPSDGCVRETVEEVGLVIPTGRLRCVEYRPLAPGAVGPPASLQFVFDGPVYDEAPPLTLQPAEIQEARWLPPEQALELAIPHLRRRLDAMRNSPGGQCVYLEDGVRLDTVNQS